MAAKESTIAPINAVRTRERVDGIKGSVTEYLYRYEMNASGAFRVSAIYTGLAVGCIGSGGKSFKSAEERDRATEASVDLWVGSRKNKSGWVKVTVAEEVR